MLRSSSSGEFPVEILPDSKISALPHSMVSLRLSSMGDAIVQRVVMAFESRFSCSY